MEILEPLLRYVSINLRTGQVAMPKEHLDHPKISAMIQEMGRKSVP